MLLLRPIKVNYSGVTYEDCLTGSWIFFIVGSTTRRGNTTCMCKFYTRIEQPILVIEAMATSAKAITVDVDNKHNRKGSLTHF